MITWSDLVNSIWLVVFLLIVCAVVFVPPFFIAWVWTRRTAHTPRRVAPVVSGYFAAFPIGFTGIVSGFLTGSSRSPAVAALIPAILTFVGLLLIYLVGRGRSRAAVAGFISIVFAAELLAGTVLGTASRDRREELLAGVAYQDARAEREFAIRQYRKGLGLPLDPPKAAPLSSSDEKP